MKLPAALIALFAWATVDATSPWSQMAARNGGIVKLNSASYDRITSTPRNYSVAITLTALPAQYKCQPCRAFDHEMKLVASSWKSSPRSDEHYFAVLDFPDGHDIFRRLNLVSAPTIRLYPATEGPRAAASPDAEVWDLLRAGGSAESFASWVSNTAKIPVNFRRPPDYTKLGSAIAMVVALIAFSYTFWPYVRRFIFGKEIWAVATNALILLMVSGYMWNQIRTPPYVMPGPKGQLNYFAAGYQQQYGVETQIIFSIYAALAFSVYTLAVTIPWMRDPLRQRIATYIWSGVLLFMFSLLLVVFRTKSGGYPFRLMF